MQYVEVSARVEHRGYSSLLSYPASTQQSFKLSHPALIGVTSRPKSRKNRPYQKRYNLSSKKSSTASLIFSERRRSSTKSKFVRSDQLKATDFFSFQGDAPVALKNDAR